MLVYDDYPKIPEHKVAVKDWSAIPEDEVSERLTFQDFRDQNGYVYRYSIIDALEMRVIQTDFNSEPVRLRYELVSFD